MNRYYYDFKPLSFVVLFLSHIVHGASTPIDHFTLHLYIYNVCTAFINSYNGLYIIPNIRDETNQILTY